MVDLKTISSEFDKEIELIDDLIDTLTDKESMIMTDGNEEPKKGEDENAEILKVLRTERSTWQNAKRVVVKLSANVAESGYTQEETKLKNKFIKFLMLVRKTFKIK